MSSRARKLIGTLAVVAYLIAYSLFAMALGGELLVGQPRWLELAGFVLLGILWLPGAMGIIRWMSKGPPG